MKLRTTTFILAILISGNLAAQETIKKEFSGIDKIDMGTGSGDCVVKRGSGDKVIVEVTHYYDDDYEPEITQSGSRLKIKDTNNNSGGWSWSGDRSPKWTLTVPDKIRLDYNTGSGDFWADDLDIMLDFNAGSGDVQLANLKGEFSGNTGSGDIEINRFDGYVKLNTGSGDVEINNSKGELNVNCGSGEINMYTVEGAIMANVGSGEIEIQKAMIMASSSFNSGSGDVEVRLAASPKANISVNSGSGDAELDFDGAKMVGTLVMKADKRRGEIEADIDFDSSEEVREYNNTIIKKTKKFDNSNIEIKIGTGSGTAAVK